MKPEITSFNIDIIKEDFNIIFGMNAGTVTINSPINMPESGIDSDLNDLKSASLEISRNALESINPEIIDAKFDYTYLGDDVSIKFQIKKANISINLKKKLPEDTIKMIIEHIENAIQDAIFAIEDSTFSVNPEKSFSL